MNESRTRFWDNRKIGFFKRHRTPIKKYWYHDDVFKSTFFDTASILIPSAEEYIVELLKKLGPQITDEKLQKAKELLSEEEAAHALVHNSYNRMIKQEGYEIDGYKRPLRNLQNFIDKRLSVKSRVAFCAAIEHFTACTSLLAIDKGIMDTGIDERMRKVWLWHFLEEIDHRTIMFDIYQYLGGGYIRRALIMIWISFLFNWYQFRTRTGLLWQSGHIFDFSVHKSGWKFLWGKNGFHKHMTGHVIKYLRPGFHPSKIHYKKALEQKVHRYPIEQELAGYFPQ